MSSEPFVLASVSPRRKQILDMMGFDFRVQPSRVTEEHLRSESGASATSVALAKARSVAREHADVLVVGADTMVVIDGGVLGKPGDSADARRMLELLSGRTHEVVTGVVLVRHDRVLAREQRTAVRFRSLLPPEIDWYLATVEPWDKAGAYAIQGRGGAFVERISGSFLNVVGFPLGLFIRMLEDFTSESWLCFLKPA